jgi:hypothetical protein
MKRLQRYYYLVGTPVFLLVLGAVFFFPEIARTVYSNPHPQINYAIFALMAGGCGLMLVHIRRINREGLLLGEFVAVMKSNDSEKLKTARTWLEKIKQSKRSDISDVLELVLDHFGKPLGAVQHAALESEIAHFQAQQQRRLLLAQFLSGMMVGLGLFGTFIGLLGALEEIGNESHGRGLQRLLVWCAGLFDHGHADGLRQRSQCRADFDAAIACVMVDRSRHKRTRHQPATHARSSGEVG